MTNINFFLILVTFKSIQDVPFPSVTVCAPNSGKWQALVEALNHYDKDGLIFEVLKNTKSIRDYFKDPLLRYFGGELILKHFEPNLESWSLESDHALPERLKLLPIEEEVFYTLHCALYAREQLFCSNDYYCSISSTDEAIFDLSFGKTNPHQIAKEIKENLCEKVLNCTAINILNTTNIPSWKDCHRNDTNSMHQNWCKNCTSLSKCVPFYDPFLQTIFNTFYTWRTYYDKRNIIDASVSALMNFTKLDLYSYQFDDIQSEALNYIQSINLIREGNLTLLDEWAYANLEVIQDNTGDTSFFDLWYLGSSDTIAATALKNCVENENEESCLLVKRFSKEIGNDEEMFWETVYQKVYPDFVPLCSHAAENHILHICNNFKKMKEGKCVTFNKSSFDHTLGQTKGLNFVVNYDYPGTSADLSEPITIMLHEHTQKPDVKNIMGMNFHAAPGHEIDLKISATVINSTEAFDEMNFNSRLCNKDIENGEFNCISDKINDWAIGNCGCQPWYLNNTQIKTCDTLGMICYKKAFANGTKDMNLKGSCYETCKNVKYSLVLLENSPMDKNINLEKYGNEFTNYIFKTERLYPYLGINSDTTWDDFLNIRLKRMSIIHINFEKSKVLSVTKDAKITLPDMIGNIGGTLGVFIGFSFLGLLDTLIEWLQYLRIRIALLNIKS